MAHIVLRVFATLLLVVVVVSVFVGSKTASAVGPDITSGLQLYYSFDSANDLGHDSSGGNHHGTLGGIVPPVASSTSVKGGSAFFNRTQLSRIDVPSDVLLADSYTKAVWVNIDLPAGGGAGIIAHASKTSKQHLFALTGASTILATNYSYAGYPVITEPFVRGRWMQAVVTYDANTQTLKLYKDGVLATSTTNVAPAVAADRTLLVGSSATVSSTRTFGGSLDELRVYTRALSAEDVAALYAFDLGATPPPPPTPPEAPAQVEATALTNAVSLVWSAVAGADSYQIEFQVQGTDPFSLFGNATSTSAIVAGLTNGTPYLFRVKTVQGQLLSTSSPVVSATPIAAVNTAPVASGVSVAGTPKQGMTLTGAYTYFDAEGDSESGSTYRWLRSSTATSTSSTIVGALSRTYVPTASDEGTYLRFGVTPVSGSSVGTEVISTPVYVASNTQTYFHVLMTGQSLSVGRGPSQSLVQPYNNLMLSPTSTEKVTRGELAPLIPLLSGAATESPVIGAANALAGFALSGGSDMRIIASSHGEGGAPYSHIKRGTDPYVKGMGQVATAKSEVENTLHGTYAPLAVTVVHGETDAGSAGNRFKYAEYLTEFQRDYQNDWSGVMGASTTIPMFFNQTSQKRPDSVAVQQLKAHRENSSLILVGPIYQYPFLADATHLHGSGGRQLGEQFGKVMYKVLVQGQHWDPLMPISIMQSDEFVFVTYHVPVPPIVIDTSLVAARAGKGFMVTQTGGNTVSVLDAEAISPTVVRLRLSAVPTGINFRVSYAANPTTDKTIGGDPTNPLFHGGNVRDSDTTVAPGAASSGNLLYNWGVSFDDQATASLVRSVTVTAATTTDSTPALSGTVAGQPTVLKVLIGSQEITQSITGSAWNVADNVVAALPVGSHTVTLSVVTPEGYAYSKQYPGVLTIVP